MGGQYYVQSSTNMVDWITIGTATYTGNGQFEFSDSGWNNLEACFYRIIRP